MNSSVIAQHCAWLTLRGDQPSSITQRRQALQRLQAALPEGVGLLDATTVHLCDWQKSLSPRLAPRSIKVETCHAIAFYRWAYAVAEPALIDHDPARKLTRIKVPKTQPRPIPEDDLATALRTAAVGGGVLFIWLCLAGYLGLRAVEISRVTREDLTEGAGGAYLLVHGKGGKDRTVPVPLAVLAHLKPHLRGRGRAFRRESGLPFTPADVSRICCAHLRNLGLIWTLHTCRHRFATALSDIGCDVRTVQELMGHQSLATTAGYIGYGARKASKSVTRLARRLQPDPNALAS